MSIVTRFAPSPTGSLHLGAARTAIFNYLYTKKNGGEFILRIEDTDQERSTNESLDEILESLEWLGINFDHGPYIQSKKLNHYKEIAERFIEQGLAYKCFMTSEEIKELKNKALAEKKIYKYPRIWRDKKDHPKNQDYVIRFKTPDNQNIEFHDTLRGKIKINSNSLDDFIILKSDGYPTYNFSTSIDDSEMKITNIIRGEDHLSNTPKQILILNALNQTPPTFTHVSMILGKDKSKLSKRNGSKSIQDFKKEGFLPEAILNYLARLGWSHGDQEIFTIKEMIELFKLENLTKSPAIYDENKLKWVNTSHIKKLDEDKLIKILGIKFCEGVNHALAVNSAKEKAKDIVSLRESLSFCETEEIKIDNELIKEIRSEHTKKIINEFYKTAIKLDSFEIENIKILVNNFIEKNNLKMKELGFPLRIILTGSKSSPGIFEILSIIGKKILIKRLRKYLEI